MSKSAKKIILNIIFYLVLAIIYAIAIFAIVTKFNNGTVYLFNKRADVVLTDSMSVRNEHHADYLADTTQIKPFDVVVSESIKEDTEIKEKDCVLFNNPDLDNKLVVHRVVNVFEEGISFKIENASKTTFNNETVFSLDLLEGKVTMAAIDYTSISIVAYSPSEYSVYYVLSEGKNVVGTTCETIKISENVYKHTITYSRTSTAPYKTYITSATDKEVFISSLTYVTKNSGALTFTADELVLDDNNSFRKLFNPYYLYEIRADKSATSDGVFERSAIKGKVVNVVPKVGHVTHFLQSIPGIIMLVGLTIIITVGSYFWNKNINKKEPETKEISNKEVDNNKSQDSKK